jgi:hypothetical protein
MSDKIICDLNGNHYLITSDNEYTNPDMTCLEEDKDDLFSITFYNVDIYKYYNIIIDYDSFNKYLNLNNKIDIIKYIKTNKKN